MKEPITDWKSLSIGRGILNGDPFPMFTMEREWKLDTILYLVEETETLMGEEQ